MSLVLHIEELIDTLFQHPTFQYKLKSFTELDSPDNSLTKLSKSIRTDISDPLEDSYPKHNPDMDSLATQIQQLLSEAYSKTTPDKFEPIEICRIHDHIQEIKEQIETIKSSCSNLKDWLEKSKKEGDSKFISAQQYKKWESQILQKIDIANTRNLKKVQSIFADKLNSFQMNIQQKVSSTKKMPVNASFDLNRELESPIQPEEKQVEVWEKTKNQTQVKEAHIMKTLKAVKSLGSLFKVKSEKS